MTDIPASILLRATTAVKEISSRMEASPTLGAAATEIIARALMEATPQWQPIETALKDGSRVLVSWGHPEDDASFCRWLLNNRTGTEFWNDDIEYDHYENERMPPEYWLPLPAIRTGTQNGKASKTKAA